MAPKTQAAASKKATNNRSSTQRQNKTGAQTIPDTEEEFHGMSAAELLQLANEMKKDPAVERVLKAAVQRVLRNFSANLENDRRSRSIVISELTAHRACYHLKGKRSLRTMCPRSFTRSTSSDDHLKSLEWVSLIQNVHS